MARATPGRGRSRLNQSGPAPPRLRLRLPLRAFSKPRTHARRARSRAPGTRRTHGQRPRAEAEGQGSSRGGERAGADLPGAAAGAFPIFGGRRGKKRPRWAGLETRAAIGVHPPTPVREALGMGHGGVRGAPLERRGRSIEVSFLGRRPPGPPGLPEPRELAGVGSRSSGWRGCGTLGEICTLGYLQFGAPCPAPGSPPFSRDPEGHELTQAGPCLLASYYGFYEN